MNNNAVLILFQKFHREFCLLLLVLFGLACGQLAATLTGVLLRPKSVAEPTSQAGAAIARTEFSSHDLAQILQKNIFDPSARNTSPTTLKASVPVRSNKKTTHNDLTMIGTLVAGDDSSVLLEISKKIQLFHLGEELPDGGIIEGIQRNKVIVRNRDKSTTELVLHDEERRPPRNRAKETRVGIRSAGENRWTVSRETADAARTNIAEQLRLAQMEPRIVNGQTNGFLVRKLYTRSLLTQMGIQRGDVILRVNNMRLDSPEKALQILQQLREARQLTVNLERNDKPMTFAYEIN